MHQLLLVSATVALISNPIGTSAQLPNGQCAVENVTCKIEDDNLVGITSDVADLSECSDLINEGDYFTYYGSAGFPFVDSCLYFSSCQNLDPCEDCVTEDVTCATPFCTAPIEGTLGGNLVSVIDNVESEVMCDLSCRQEEQCAVYTFHRSNDTTYANTCFLLSALGEPIRECEADTCVTGLPNCEGGICKYLDEGVMLPQGVLVTEGERNISLSLLILGVCPSPVAIAIGGGSDGYLGGGGSGYVDYSVNWHKQGYTKLQAYPGSDNEDSYIRDITENMDVVRGGRGLIFGGYDGGAGYSGGGGYGNNGFGGGYGGSDGSDGTGSSPGDGGVGSDLKIDTIPLSTFVLSPGEGGIANGYGGGGGGVLIDGQGPDRPEFNVGEGFGGGGWYFSSANPGCCGLPGAVILDFVPEK